MRARFVGVVVVATSLVLVLVIVLWYFMSSSRTLAFLGTVSSSSSSFQMVTVTNQPRDTRLGLLLTSASEKSGFVTEERVLLKCDPPFSWAKRLTLWKDYYSTLPRDTVVLSVDAFDVVLLAPKEEMMKKFIESGASLLFGYTDYCWPTNCDMCIRYLRERHPRLYSTELQKMMYLCAGTYIGRAGYLADLLHKNPWTDDVDDQCYFATIFLQQPTSSTAMKLDEKNSIFQNTTPTALQQGYLSVDKEEKRSINNVTKTRPCVFHFDSYHPSHDELSYGYQHLQGHGQ